MWLDLPRHPSNLVNRKPRRRRHDPSSAVLDAGTCFHHFQDIHDAPEGMKHDKGLKSGLGSTDLGYGRDRNMNPSALPMQLLSPAEMICTR